MNYDRAYQLISYVESLPPGTRFDYLNPQTCLFGHWRQSTYARLGGLPYDASADSIGHFLGMDKWQMCWLYGGLLGHGEKDYRSSMQYNRLEICRRARNLLAKWEADEAIAAAGKDVPEAVCS